VSFASYIAVNLIRIMASVPLLVSVILLNLLVIERHALEMHQISTYTQLMICVCSVWVQITIWFELITF